MPCLFKTAVKNSGIHGKGFYALEDIPKGAVYWVWDSEDPLSVEGYDAKPNRIYSKDQLYEVKVDELMKHILHTGFYYADADLFVELRDGTEFTNHSDDWNSQIIYDESKDYRKMTCVARKAIKAGDEITGITGTTSLLTPSGLTTWWKNTFPRGNKSRTMS